MDLTVDERAGGLEGRYCFLENLKPQPVPLHAQDKSFRISHSF